MQDSTALSVAPTVPDYLLELPESVVEAPPVETRIPELPFDQLSWQNFERVMFSSPVYEYSPQTYILQIPKTELISFRLPDPSNSDVPFILTSFPDLDPR